DGRRQASDGRNADGGRAQSGRDRSVPRRRGVTGTVSALSTQALIAGYERDLPIVRGIDFAVQAGELVVILGPNGAGKSTFVKAIAGLVTIHSGTVRLGDSDVTLVPAHEKIRKGLAFVPQTENIFTTLSINENLLVAASILPKSARARRIDDLYRMFPD